MFRSVWLQVLEIMITRIMSPSAVLVIHDGITRLVNVKNQDSVSKIIDMIPDIIDKIKSFKDGKKDPDIEKAVDDVINE